MARSGAHNGVGIGWRPELAAELLRRPEALDLVEIVAEACFTQGRARKEALALAELWPVVPHGVKLSLGSAAGLDIERARKLGALARDLRAGVVTEHVAFTHSRRREIGHLTPLPRTREALRVLEANVAALRRHLPDVPLLLENIAWAFSWPDDEMSEGDFYCEVVARTGCDLLLDVANLYANARNAGQEPSALLRAYPLERVGMVHLAGGVFEHGFYYDTHAHPTPPPVFALLEELLRVTGPLPVILERDASFPAFAEIEAELGRARALLEKAGATAEPPPRAPLDPNLPRGGEIGGRLQPPAGSSPGEAPEAGVGARLALAQDEVAEILTRPAPPEDTRGLDRGAVLRARGVLARKRVDDALPLLAHLAGRAEALFALALRCLDGVARPEVGAAISDALRVAEAAGRDPALAEDAARDRLLLRARFAGPARDGGMRPRVAPFLGRETLRPGRRLWALKGPGAGADIRLFETGSAAGPRHGG